MQTLSELLVLCEGNPSVIDGFPSQKASNLLCFFDASPNQILKYTPRETGDLRHHNAHVGNAKRRVMTCQLAAQGCFSAILISYNDQQCDYTSMGEIWSRGVSRK